MRQFSGACRFVYNKALSSAKQEPTEVIQAASHRCEHGRNPLPLGRGGCQLTFVCASMLVTLNNQEFFVDNALEYAD